ncbi:DUF808 domain-containing protein [Pistricoccus aurantiacus]|uniref:DUF808 domain-containing protein n=1 Tax=Pistricoccus aurantiacus TaxID=1883414 RepID=UPI00362F447C
MAGASLLTLIDDIATLLDDVSVLTKVAAKKTAGVLGDDLALNAQQVTGVKASRELPVVWAVAKGSFINKCFLVPGALLISAFIPWAVTLLLILGGAFLCFEGAEKLAHKFLHGKEDEKEHAEKVKALADPGVDPVALEKRKIKGAIRTDFILSAEIIAITLGTVAAAPLLQQVVVLSLVAIAVTVGVYGLVAGIVKLDDLGLYLNQKSGAFVQTVGRGLLVATPYLMRGLSIFGTIAMFLVGGGILTHGIPVIDHSMEEFVEYMVELPGADAIFQSLGSMLFNLAVGLVAGALLLLIVEGFQSLRQKTSSGD